jgi:hypothetical protein
MLSGYRQKKLDYLNKLVYIRYISLFCISVLKFLVFCCSIYFYSDAENWKHPKYKNVSPFTIELFQTKNINLNPLQCVSLFLKIELTDHITDFTIHFIDKRLLKSDYFLQVFIFFGFFLQLYVPICLYMFDLHLLKNWIFEMCFMLHMCFLAVKYLSPLCIHNEFFPNLDTPDYDIKMADYMPDNLRKKFAMIFSICFYSIFWYYTSYMWIDYKLGVLLFCILPIGYYSIVDKDHIDHEKQKYG